MRTKHFKRQAFANRFNFVLSPQRDKIQAKYVELLATAAASDMSMVPNELDESILCASPGKVVDAFTLRQILRRAPEEHVYFGGSKLDKLERLGHES